MSAVETHLVVTFEASGVITGPVAEDYEQTSLAEIEHEFCTSLMNIITDECPPDTKISIKATAKLVHLPAEGTDNDQATD